LFFDKLGHPPEPGSLQEAVCLIIQNYRWKQRFYLDMAHLQAAGSKERMEAFEEYKKVFLPHLTKADVDQVAQAKQLLDQVFRDGPLLIRVEDPGPTGRGDMDRYGQ